MSQQENLPVVDEKLAINIAKCHIQGKSTAGPENSPRSLMNPSCISSPIALPISTNVKSCDMTNSKHCSGNENKSNNSITDVCSGVQNLTVTIPANGSSLPTFSTKFGDSVISNLFPLENSRVDNSFMNDSTYAQYTTGGNNNCEANKPCSSVATIFPSSHVRLNFLENNSSSFNETSPKLIAKKRQYRLLKKSPHKTSPLKKISPILRQQFRRIRKCKVTSPRKLKFILPKQIRKKSRTLLAKLVLPEACKTPDDPTVDTNVGGSIQDTSENSSTVQFDQNDVGNDSCSFSFAERSTASCITTSLCSNDAILSDRNLDMIPEEASECDIDDSNTDQQQQLQEEHLVAFLKASSTIAMQRGGKKKNLSGLNKHQKALLEKITALSYSPDLKSQENDLAMSYLIRVRKALTSKDPKIFNDFVALFNNYSTASDSPESLYLRVCELLDGFDELKEEFVMFLTPDQAVKVGKFHEYCIFARMREFFDELKYHSSRQLQNFSKIFKTFQTLNNRSNISKEEFFEILTPILRFQPHLIESLNQLLPASQPMESLPDDFEVINMEDDNENKPEDFEVINMIDNDPKIFIDNCFCRCHRTSLSTNANAQSSQQAKMEHCVSCGLRFLNGGVYLQYGKSLRPTQIIYSTNSQEEKNTTVEDSCSLESQSKPKFNSKYKDSGVKLIKPSSKNRLRRIKQCGSSSSDSTEKSNRGKSAKRKFSKVQK